MLEEMISCPPVPTAPVFVMVIVVPSLVAETKASASDATPFMAVVNTVAKCVEFVASWVVTLTGSPVPSVALILTESFMRKDKDPPSSAILLIVSN